MKPDNKSDTDLCASCGRPVPEGQTICRTCEKCNGYSAANWLARHLNQQKDASKEAEDSTQ